MANKILGVGWRFPVAVDPLTGRIATSKYEQDVKESIGIILSTRKGERVMQPEFGCGIHDYVFEVMNTATLGMIKTNVKNALVRWESRIYVDEVEVRPENDLGRLIIDIAYRIRSTNNEFNFVYPFYLTDRR